MDILFLSNQIEATTIMQSVLQASRMALGTSCLLQQKWLLSLTENLAVAWAAEFSFLMTQLIC